MMIKRWKRGVSTLFVQKVFSALIRAFSKLHMHRQTILLNEGIPANEGWESMRLPIPWFL